MMFFNSNHVETSITSSAYTVVAVNGNTERNVERNRSALKAKERVLLYPPVQKQASACLFCLITHVFFLCFIYCI